MTFKDEFQTLFDTYAKHYDARDADGCAAIYHADGEIFSPFGPPVIGRRAIRDIHAEWFNPDETDKAVTIAEAHAEGDLGWCIAKYSSILPQENAPPMVESGTSVNVLTRHTRQGWQVRVTSLNKGSNNT